jgi:hypothetical protein
MIEIELSAPARERRGEWRQGVPGAIGLLAAIGFGVGIVDRDMREQLPDVLAICALVALACGALYLMARRSLQRELVVGKDGAGAFVRLAGVGELRAPLSYRFGHYRELVEAGVARATVDVLFVTIEGRGGPPITVRKALGAAFSAPAAWKPSRIAMDPTHVLMRIEELPRALDRIGAEKKEIVL